MKQSKPASPGEVIGQLNAGQFATIESFKGGSGSLQARRLSNGDVKLYWRYTHENDKLRDEIGLWDSSAPPRSMTPTAKGYSIRAAVEVCRERAKVHTEGKLTGGWPGHKERMQADRDRTRAEAVKALADAALKSEQTLSRLLDTYCDYLEGRGRPSHADARSIFRVHVKTTDLAEFPAADVTAEELTDVIRKVNDAGKGRTANKLRSYLHAAYQCALRARLSSKLPASFKAFKIVANPVEMIATDPENNKPDKNPLTPGQLRQYWQALAPLEGVKGASLRLHLLTGGQRIEQFIKLLKTDVLPDRIVLIDSKGRRIDPLRHSIALTPAAQKEVRTLQALSETVPEITPKNARRRAARAAKQDSADTQAAVEAPKPFLITTDGGKTHVSSMTLSRWAKSVAIGIADFQLKQVRSGVETALAGAKVRMDLRGLLQSHGLSSLQRRHYDGNDYTPDIKNVLLTLERLLNGVEKAARPRKKSAATSA